MRATTLLFLSLFGLTATAQTTYRSLPAQSTLTFAWTFFGIGNEGTLAAPEVEVVFAPFYLAKCRISATADITSLDTDNKTRDKHLRGEDWLTTGQYPSASFRAQGFWATANGYQTNGTLTIRGIEKPLTMGFTATDEGDHKVFAGSFVITREDFGFGGGAGISDDITVRFRLVTEAVAE